jgi:hypothetical protein
MQMRKRKKIYIDGFKNSLRVRYANDWSGICDLRVDILLGKRKLCD